jgi:hypothetical protein
MVILEDIRRGFIVAKIQPMQLTCARVHVMFNSRFTLHQKLEDSHTQSRNTSWGYPQASECSTTCLMEVLTW